jgi:hypothetical protein
VNAGPASGSEPLTTVSIVAGPLVGPVLRRVVGMLAARADLPWTGSTMPCSWPT